MTWLLNQQGVQCGAAPAAVEAFTDLGSVAHLALGYIAGSDWLTGKDTVMFATAFAGYQLSQAQWGVPWSRTGGELIEFALGMLLARLYPQVLPQLLRLGREEA